MSTAIHSIAALLMQNLESPTLVGRWCHALYQPSCNQDLKAYWPSHDNDMDTGPVPRQKVVAEEIIPWEHPTLVCYAGDIFGHCRGRVTISAIQSAAQRMTRHEVFSTDIVTDTVTMNEGKCTTLYQNMKDVITINKDSQVCDMSQEREFIYFPFHQLRSAEMRLRQ